jgi:CRISPR/Cas system-associated exonuclease Cas4 (RecB family)
MPGRILRASEIGEYLFCKRAWWLRRQGIQPANRRALDAGTAAHAEHARSVVFSGCLRTAAFVMLIAAVVLAAVGATILALG